MSKLKFEGTPVKIGNTMYVCPALSLRQVKLHKDDITILNKGILASDGEEAGDRLVRYTEVLARVLFAALSRNYENLSADDIDDGLGMDQVSPTAAVLLGISGFAKVGTQEEADALLESEAKTAGESTGTA